MLLKEKNSVLKDKINTVTNSTEITKSKIEQQEKYIRDIAALTQENKKKYEKYLS